MCKEKNISSLDRGLYALSLIKYSMIVWEIWLF